MHHGRRHCLALRAVSLLAGCGALGWGTWSLVRAPLLTFAASFERNGTVPPLSLQTSVAGLCAAVLLACVLWVSGLVLVSVAGALARELSPRSNAVLRFAGRVERRSPVLVRRAVTTFLGVTIGAGLAIPAFAASGPPPTPAALTGLPLPERAAGADLATAARTDIHPSPPTRRSTARQPAHVEVRPGDSLWRIAQRLLGPGATDGEITRTWHRIHRVNRARIGADPDLIRPGTRLTVPPQIPRRKDRS